MRAGIFRVYEDSKRTFVCVIDVVSKILSYFVLGIFLKSVCFYVLYMQIVLPFMPMNNSILLHC